MRSGVQSGQQQQQQQKLEVYLDGATLHLHTARSQAHCEVLQLAATCRKNRVEHQYLKERSLQQMKVSKLPPYFCQVAAKYSQMSL